MAFNKMASVLRNLAVKRASEMFVDSFITKVASALPITKRAAFRTLQAQLATGDSLPDAIKVAFPKLDAIQRHGFAINLCKCAVADANKMTQRSPESYTVPAKDGAKTMREKCSGLTPEKDKLPLGELKTRRAAMTDDRFRDKQKQVTDKMTSAVRPAMSRSDDIGLDYKSPFEIGLTGSDLYNQPSQTPTNTNYMDYLKNPYVLGGLVGAGGLGAYGLYNLLKKRRRRPVAEMD